VAILFAARHMDLVGVTTVHGNNTLENTTRNGLIALELGGLDVPLAAGCSEPLVQPSVGVAPGMASPASTERTSPNPRARRSPRMRSTSSSKPQRATRKS
jgi:inosine-uridine nucleoside N-ribohydrolase